MSIVMFLGLSGAWYHWLIGSACPQTSIHISVTIAIIWYIIVSIIDWVTISYLSRVYLNHNYLPVRVNFYFVLYMHMLRYCGMLLNIYIMAVYLFRSQHVYIFIHSVIVKDLGLEVRLMEYDPYYMSVHRQVIIYRCCAKDIRTNQKSS